MKSLNSSQSNSANPSTTQHKTSEIIDRFTGKEYLNATGNLKFGLTNDVMFRIVFRKTNMRSRDCFAPFFIWMRMLLST